MEIFAYTKEVPGAFEKHHGKEKLKYFTLWLSCVKKTLPLSYTEKPRPRTYASIRNCKQILNFTFTKYNLTFVNGLRYFQNIT